MSFAMCDLMNYVHGRMSRYVVRVQMLDELSLRRLRHDGFESRHDNVPGATCEDPHLCLCAGVARVIRRASVRAHLGGRLCLIFRAAVLLWSSFVLPFFCFVSRRSLLLLDASDWGIKGPQDSWKAS